MIQNRKGLILMYHRIATLSSDPWALAVTPEHFHEHLEVIHKFGHPMSLLSLTEELKQESVSDRSIAVTFDDGYSDNLHNAIPILERHNIPATMFIVSGRLDHQEEFWWDELDRLLLQPGHLPETLNISIGEKNFDWKLGNSSQYSSDECMKNSSWRTWHDAPTVRHEMYYTLWQQLRPLSENERMEKIHMLRSWADAGVRGRDSHRILSSSELLLLASDALIEIGCHTVSHPRLSELSYTDQLQEIHESKRSLEERINRPVKNFAYPFGSKEDYTLETAEIVRETGFTSACCTVPETVSSKPDFFQLPRVQVEDWNGDEFEKRLNEWFASTLSN